MSLRQVEQGFSLFFAKFMPYLMIFQSFTATLVVSGTLGIIYKYRDTSNLDITSFFK